MIGRSGSSTPLKGMPPAGRRLTDRRPKRTSREHRQPLGTSTTVSASLEEVQQTARDLGLAYRTPEFVKGWFDQTLPANRDRIGPIAILRIDGDWYSSVRCCLDNLYDQVVDGGFVILDDYYTFEGCAIALHEFLGERRLAHRIESMVSESADNQHYWGAVFRKGNATWFEARNHMKWMHRQELIAHDIATLVPPTDAVIHLVGKEELAGEVAGRAPCDSLPRTRRAVLGSAPGRRDRHPGVGAAAPRRRKPHRLRLASVLVARPLCRLPAIPRIPICLHASERKNGRVQSAL